VLFCFVTNAFKYTQEGTIELGCSIQNEQLRFYVRDTGIGVRNEDKPHIFDRFFRAVDAQKRAIRGTGLGLSIAKELVEIMGGTINVESEPGKGSEFYFLLPFVSAPDARKTAISKKPVPDLSHATILIAEDDENSYEYLNALLRKKVNRLFRVKNGDDLLLFLHNVTPDIILMDLVMPVLDGFEASKRIRKIHPRLPIIAITAYTEPEQQKLAIEAGCDYFMSKPINSEDLLELLGRITGRSISS
ncbi:response regulator, partial [bacterium]|nr:response regulator [bacterium]